MNSKKTTSDNSGSSKNPKRVRSQNVLESLKDIGGSTTNSFKKDLVKGTSEDFLKQLLGRYPSQRKISGELTPGESLEVDKAYSGEHQRVVQEKRQLVFLNKLKEEESQMIRREKGALQYQLKTLQEELLKLVESTQDIAKETQIAAMSAPVEPGVYHVQYFEKLIEFIKSFRKQLGSASLWMAETNKRAQKKNYWSRYKKNGSKFLLSADHYLTRSAG